MRHYSVSGSKYVGWFGLMAAAVLLPAGSAVAMPAEGIGRPRTDIAFSRTYPEEGFGQLPILDGIQPSPEVLDAGFGTVLVKHPVQQEGQQPISKTGNKQNPRAGEADRLNQEGVQLANQAKYLEALKRFEQSLAIQEEIGDRWGEGLTLNNIGFIYSRLGEYAKALDFYEQSLSIREEIGDRRGVGSSLNNIGDIYSRLGEYAKALDLYEQALAIRKEMFDRRGVGDSLNNIGSIYDILGEYAKALDFYEQALAIQKGIGDRQREGLIINNIGFIYSNLGEYAKALDFYEQALAIQKGIGDRWGVGDSLSNIGFIYFRLGEYAKALDFYEQALAIQKGIGDRQREGGMLNNISLIYLSLGEYAKALTFFEQALAIQEEIGDRRGEGLTLNNIGGTYARLDDYAKALDFYEQSLAIREELGDQAGEGLTLWNIGDALSKHDQPELAVIFLKRSVNVYEDIRGSLISLDDDLQASYTDSISATYRQLADLLLQQDRVLEAQRVLDLLKVQELQDYLETVRGNARTASGIDYYQPEQEILTRYNEIQASAIEIGQQLAALNKKDTETGLTDSEITERNDLYQLQKQLRKQFNEFADTPEIQGYITQLTRVDGTLPITEITGLTDKLDQLNAVLIYPLVLDDRIELIITTPDSAPLRRTVENVSRQQLNDAITRFRQDLSTPNSSAKASAYQLYRWLIEPLEADLADAGLTTILYAPDGPLRYVPLAALYDSANPDDGQWLTQRFQVNNITATSLQELDTQPPENPRILAGAFADKSIVHTVNIGDKPVDFTGLPFAGIEVTTLAETLSNIRTYLDHNFSLALLEPQLNNFNILHFATHASLVPKDAGESFILFGNGDQPTIRDIADWQLDDVDLVVLSACETGLGGFDNNGEQILGLGYQFQRVGARAVIASLWQVDDGGTQALMNAFYLALRNGFSKTEALQKAQQALIEDDLSLVGEPRGTIQVVDGTTGEPVALKGSSDHPYYWAPFILIGNGL